MEPSHERLQEIFLRVRELTPDRRPSALAAACGDDVDLRAEVERLLDADETRDRLVTGAGLARAGGPPDPSENPTIALGGHAHPPERIGHYHIRSVIASGGMGTLYEAFQEQPRRRVAVKVMKFGVASRSALRRFEFESQLLARLRHPHIVQVYEAGTHDEGDGAVPFFAMEYVPGAKTIIEYAARKRLGTRERLHLFAQACEAVHHGHQKGIIHRDLKPGNILVDSAGEPKIIDFGVARATDSDMVVTTLQTDIGQLVGTLQYMSPEQCDADPQDLDIRSDVYSLGVVMYELLCGNLPYDVSRAAVHQVARIIQESAPTPPSTVDRMLRGDVETITLKALEKERERRYQSAADLAQDIRRYLNNQPIDARRPSVAYQFRKFARRHRALITGAGGVVIALVGGLTAATIGFVQANDARAESEVVTSFLEEMLAAVDPEEQGSAVTVREVLDEAGRRIGDDFSDHGIVEARLRTVMGNTYRALGHYVEAERHLPMAREIRRRLLGERDPETLEAAHDLGLLYKDQGRFEEAEPLLARTLEARERVLGEDDPRTLDSLSALAALHRERGRFGEAELFHQRALEARRRTLGPEDRATLQSMNNLATLYKSDGRLDEARELYEETLAIQHRALGDEHLDTLATANNLANLYDDLGQYDEAEELLRRALDTARADLGAAHPRTLRTMNNLALLLQARHQYDEAEPLLAETVRLRKQVLSDDHPRLLKSIVNLANLYLRKEDYEEAERLYRQVLSVQKRTLTEKHADTLKTMNNLAILAAETGRLEKAEQQFARTLELRRAHLRPSHPHTLKTMTDLATLLERQGRSDEAISLLDEAALGADELPTQHRFVAMIAAARGRTLASLARYAESERALLDAYELMSASPGEHDPRTIEIADDIVAMYDAWGKPTSGDAWRARLDSPGSAR